MSKVISSQDSWRPRRWRGHWLQCWGECSPEDAAGCCLGCSNPCGVVYGWNVSKVLRVSFWKEVLKFVAIILLVRAVFYVVHYGNMYACILARLNVIGQDSKGNLIIKMLGGPPSDACTSTQVAQYILYCVYLVCLLFWALFVGGRRRRQMRQELGIPATAFESKCCPCCHQDNEYCNDDCCLHFCCMPCALAQETRTILHEEATGSRAPRLLGSHYTSCGTAEVLTLAPYEKDMKRTALALPV